MLHRRCFLIGTGSLLAAAGLPGAHAAGWPAPTLKMLVASAVGGVPDVRARWLAERLGPVLGSTIVTENRPALGGAVAMSEGGRAAADGSVAIFTHQGVMTITPHLHPRLGYDPLVDFVPVTRFGVSSLALAVHPEARARTLADLLRQAQEQEDGLRYASAGIGTPPHLATELLLRQIGLAATHIPYKGGADAVRALIGRQVDFQIEGLSLLLPQVRAGRVRVLAVTAARRQPVLPDVPTLAEAGADGYDYVGWTGVVMPAGTAPALVRRLAGELAGIAQSAEGSAWFAAHGAEPGLLQAEAFGALIQAEHARHGRLIRDAGIRLE